jgi:hypothetical protein
LQEPTTASDPRIKEALLLIQTNFDLEGLPNSNIIMDALYAVINAHNAEKGILTLRFLRVALSHFLYLPTTT